MVLDRVRARLRSHDDFRELDAAVIDLRDVQQLCRLYGWSREPILDDPTIDEFDYLEDVNDRRRLDAACLATVVRNVDPAICLEIGTAEGHGTALIAVNAPQATVHTVNIPPEQLAAGEGGTLTTAAFERDRIGVYYRERGLTNVVQVLANTATWQPDFGPIDVAYIDGSHDADFVYGDTRKVIARARPGSFVLWHDFNPSLIAKYHWIREVCRGVERLLREGIVRGRILHVRDSWTGIYRVP